MKRYIQRLENYNKQLNFCINVCKLCQESSNSILARPALINTYELTFELAWKVLKDYLKDEKGIEVLSPKESIKKAYEQEIITNQDLWLEMLEARNSATHEYSDDRIELIYKNIINLYINEFIHLRNYFGDK